MYVCRDYLAKARSGDKNDQVEIRPLKKQPLETRQIFFIGMNKEVSINYKHIGHVSRPEAHSLGKLAKKLRKNQCIKN